MENHRGEKMKNFFLVVVYFGMMLTVGYLLIEVLSA